MIKVNFKQPKYIFPLVIFVPLCALIYFVMQTFGGGESGKQEVATDRINMELPEARAEEAGDKMYEMSRPSVPLARTRKRTRVWSTAIRRKN